MPTPAVQRLGSAVLLQGPAVADVAFLVGLGMRYRARVDGTAPSAHHRALLSLTRPPSPRLAAIHLHSCRMRHTTAATNLKVRVASRLMLQPNDLVHPAQVVSLETWIATTVTDSLRMT